MKKIKSFEVVENQPFTALLYGPPGVGKTTALGKFSEQQKGKMLIADVDRTTRALGKKNVIKSTDNILIRQIDNVNTWEDWTNFLQELEEADLSDIETIAVDNISELERSILADLGRKGKNKGVPAMSDYQYMQFKLMNSLRHMKRLGVNIIWTAWETTNDFEQPDGSKYSRQYPQISHKIVDNICGLCDIVGKISVNKEGKRGILLEATQNIYAKNQIDDRQGVLVEEFIKSTKK